MQRLHCSSVVLARNEPFATDSECLAHSHRLLLSMEVTDKVKSGGNCDSKFFRLSLRRSRCLHSGFVGEACKNDRSRASAHFQFSNAFVNGCNSKCQTRGEIKRFLEHVHGKPLEYSSLAPPSLAMTSQWFCWRVAPFVRTSKFGALSVFDCFCESSHSHGQIWEN